MAFDLAAFQALMAANTIPDIDLGAIDLSENYADIEPAPQPTEEEQLAAIQAYVESNGPIVDLGLGDGNALTVGLGYGDAPIVGTDTTSLEPVSEAPLVWRTVDGIDQYFGGEEHSQFLQEGKEELALLEAAADARRSEGGWSTFGPQLVAILAILPTPLQPFAQAAQAAAGVADGDVTFSDVLNLAGAAGIPNPISSVTNTLNDSLGLADSAFALTDDVLVNLAEGDLQGAALDYANADMVDVDLDSSIGNALASLDDNVIQPIASLGNELLDPFTGVLEPLSDIGSGINDAAQPLIEAASSVEDAVVATGDAIQTVADPIIDPIVAMGDVVQENIIDPAVQLASNFEDAARTPITAVGDAIQTVADPVIQAVNTVGDAAQENIIDPVVAVGDVVQDVVIDPVVAVGDVVQDVVIDPIVDVAAQVEDVVSEAIPSLPDTPDLSDIEYPDINIPTPDLSFIPTLFSDLLASTGTTATDTTDMKSLFSDDLFKFKNEIITV